MSSIILIGFMGCGKSSIGRRLSYRVRKTFIDTDKWIETREHKTVKKIFSEYGEEFFRSLETACLDTLLEETEEHVIAVGGGLPIVSRNWPKLKNIGIVVFLRVKPETICSRLKHDKKRPLLQCENPQEKICEMMGVRNPIYEELADIIIDVDLKEFPQILKEIYDKVNRLEQERCEK